MKTKASRAARIVAASAVLAFPTIATAAGSAPKPTAVPAFAPVRIRTQALTATGLGTVEAPFSPFRTTTAPLRAEGLGTVEAPFQPVHIRTQTLSAAGAATGGPK